MTKEPTFLVDGIKISFPVDLIPGLFCAYIAAVRADHYAEVDKSEGEDYATTFKSEMHHALRHREDIKDWMENNMDPHLADTIRIDVKP
jgi:hypothetical protein